MLLLLMSCMGSKVTPMRHEVVYPLRLKTKFELVKWEQSNNGIDFQAKVAADCDWSHHFQQAYTSAAETNFSDLSPMLAPYNPNQHAVNDKERFIMKPFLKGYRIYAEGVDGIGCSRELHDTKHELVFKLKREAFLRNEVIQRFIVDVKVLEDDISHPNLTLNIQADDGLLKVCSEAWNASSQSNFPLKNSHLVNSSIPYSDIAQHLNSYVDCENRLEIADETFLTMHDPAKWKMTLKWGEKSEDITLVGSSMVQTQLCQTERINKKYDQFATLFKIGDYKPNHLIVDKAQKATISYLFTQCSVDQLMPMLCDKDWMGERIIGRIKNVIRMNENALNPDLLKLYATALQSSQLCISDVELMANIDFLIHMALRLSDTKNESLLTNVSRSVIEKFSDRLPETWVSRNKKLLSKMPLDSP